MSVSRLHSLDFQLAYLILLTREGIKPLSRWEGHLAERDRELILSSGLIVETPHRRTRFGRKIVETIFSTHPGYVGLYQKRFDGTSLREKPEAIRLEGQLFGYPSCCVEEFIRKPYVPNGLDPQDQEILFHWTCPDCEATRTLLRDYRLTHNECRRLFGSRFAAESNPSKRWTGALAKVAASVVLAAGTAGLASMDDPHWLPAQNDVDNDYLSHAEEILRGTDWWNLDTDQDGDLDGVQTAYLLSQLIASPPPGVVVDEYTAFGLETCSICGESVNMGFIRIIHLHREISCDLPFIGVHYLEHGGLSYLGSFHGGRVDLGALKAILLPCDPGHLLDASGMDPDDDGLFSEEELLLGTDPYDPDTDGDTLEDGPQVAEELLPLIGDLPLEETPDRPYMLEWQADGLEQCEVCGVTYNMGFAEIVNPVEGFSVGVPYVALHTLAHGGFVFDGTYNDGRIIPSALKNALLGDGTSHWVPLSSDTDGDGLTDDEEAFFDLDPEDPDQDGDGIPDGRHLAKVMSSVIRDLPEGPLPDELYVIRYLTAGFYYCLSCGEPINMGHLEIVDPVEGRSELVPFYNLHFMDRGSFSTDRDDLYPRVDPCALGEILGVNPSSVQPIPTSPALALWNAPNPFTSAAQTQIVLALPVSIGRVEAAVYDNSGRRVCDLFSGNEVGKVLRLRWDGRDGGGREVAPGIYFARLRIGDITFSRKMTLAD